MICMSHSKSSLRSYNSLLVKSPPTLEGLFSLTIAGVGKFDSLQYKTYNAKELEPTPEKLSSQEWKFWLSGVATLITGLFGLLGNGVSLVVLCRRWFYLKKLDHEVFILPMEMKVELCNCIYLWSTGIRITVMRKRIVILLGFRVPL